MLYTALFAYVTVVMMPANWFMEFKADKTAANLVGKENIKSALLTIQQELKINSASETHQTIPDRIKLIEKQK